jgi:phage terminase small subunit
MKARGLTAKQQRFVDQYLIDLNSTAAAVRAGYSPKTASRIGPELLGKTCVAAAVKIAMNARADRTKITQDQVLQRWWDIANANANDVVQFRRGACRFCYGKNHAFQWKTEREYEEACAEAKATRIEPPVCDGGFGYDATLTPHARCPECHGEGVGRVLATDTASLSGSALLLYDGLKATKDGMEIKLRDRDKAMEMVARHLGMFNDKLKIQGDTENPIALLVRQCQGSALPVVPYPSEDDEGE